MCGLCTLVDPHSVIHEGRHWRVKHNLNPNIGTSLHLVIFTRAHLVSIRDLSGAMRLEYFELLEWSVQELGIPGCAVLMRLGDSAFHGGTMEHLHYHVQVPARTVPVVEYFFRPQGIH